VSVTSSRREKKSAHGFGSPCTKESSALLRPPSASRSRPVPLYPAPADSPLELEARRRVPVVALPDRLDYPSSWAFVRALAGRRPLNNQVSHVHEAPSWWWSAVVELGGRFAWAGPAETEDRIARLSQGCVPPVRDVASSDQPKVVVLP
jgi:hypothetical protein